MEATIAQIDDSQASLLLDTSEQVEALLCSERLKAEHEQDRAQHCDSNILVIFRIQWEPDSRCFVAYAFFGTIGLPVYVQDCDLKLSKRLESECSVKLNSWLCMYIVVETLCFSICYLYRYHGKTIFCTGYFGSGLQSSRVAIADTGATVQPVISWASTVENRWGHICRLIVSLWHAPFKFNIPCSVNRYCQFVIPELVI